MRLRTLALVCAASLGLLSFGAGSASAAPATLPDGDTLFGIACPYYSTDDSQLPNMQLIELNTATAAGTLVGPGTPSLTDANCAGQGAFNPVTGIAYALAQDFTDETDTVLVTVDPVSGVSTLVGGFSVQGAPPVPVDVESIAISPAGVAYASGDVGGANGLYTIDLATGDLTLVAAANFENYTLAFDPTSGILYTLDSGGNLYSVNTDTAFATLLNSTGVNGVYSFAIDTSGTFWVNADVSLGGLDYQADLYSFELDDLGNPQFAGTVSVDATNPYIEALLLVWDVPVSPTPQLAATGLTVDGTLVGGAFVLLLAGIATLFAVRRTRRA